MGGPQAAEQGRSDQTAADGDGDPERARVVAAMALQSWFRAARARAEAIGERLPETLGTSSNIVSPHSFAQPPPRATVLR